MRRYPGPPPNWFTCELTVQALWCFTCHLQQMVEDGQAPSMPERYSWRFLCTAQDALRENVG
ncbi:hypothetical protein ACPEIF_27095 [Streptomyces sp. NPDC012600]|uniref:hypothetical protein n=1 Tax=Streptomyces sp. NPDC012600 TaxID=3415005 RepID=UPI003C2ABC17